MSYSFLSRRVERLYSEDDVLAANLPQFKVYDLDDPDKAFVGGWELSSGNRYDYQLILDLPSGYPDAMPCLYITQPRPLYRHDGTRIPEYSHDFHTMGAGKDGQTQICHCHSDEWDPWRSILAVMLRGLLWIHLYEKHLRTGHPVDSLFTEIVERLP